MQLNPKKYQLRYDSVGVLNRSFQATDLYKYEL